MAAARPYRFQNLPRLTKSQVALYASLCQTLSERPLQPDFMPGLEEILGQILRGGCRVLRGELRQVATTDLLAQAPALGCFAVVRAAPSAAPIIVDIDAGLAARAVDRILGGSGDAPRMPRPWTDFEIGILSFAVLQVLAFVQGGMVTGREMALVLEQVHSSLADVRASLGEESHFFQLGYRLDLGGRIGYGRVLLPQSMVQERFAADPPTDAEPTPQELVGMRQNLRFFAREHVRLHIVAAPLDLQQSDVVNVEVGDIIVLEDHRLKKTPGGIEGEVTLKLGRGKHAQLRARLHNEAAQTRLEIIDIASHAQLQEEPMAEEHPSPQEEDDDNLAETAGLLRDVDTSVAIELGRLRLSAAQVVRLRRGQMLRLPRGPNDPVDLVVNGKLFAKGELIEVDGELGVRLTQLHAAS